MKGRRDDCGRREKANKQNPTCLQSSQPSRTLLKSTKGTDHKATKADGKSQERKEGAEMNQPGPSRNLPTPRSQAQKRQKAEKETPPERQKKKIKAKERSEADFHKARTVTIFNALQVRGTSVSLVSWVVSGICAGQSESSGNPGRLPARHRGEGEGTSRAAVCLPFSGVLSWTAFWKDWLNKTSRHRRTRTTVCDRMQMACRIIQGLYTETGFSVNPTKTESVLFSRRRKLEDFRAPTMHGRSLALSRETCVKIDSDLLAASEAVGRTWGLIPNILQRIYTASMTPNTIWVGDTVALCTEIHSGPKFRTHIKACLHGHHNSNEDDPNCSTRDSARAADGAILDQDDSDGGTFKNARLRVVEANHLSRLDKSFTLTIANIEVCKRGEIQFPEEALVCYTNGSRLASGQASGGEVYVENRGVRESYSLGTNTTIFEAEVYAILSAACNEEPGGTKPGHLVQECTERLEELARLKEVTLMWVPGHTGVPGNEEADRLARLGTREQFVGPEPAIGNVSLQKEGERYHSEHWRQSEGCQQAKDFIVGLYTSRSAWLRNQGRWALRNLVGILTGHCRLRRHLSLLGIEEDSLCMGCGEADETAYHFLAESCDERDSVPHVSDIEEEAIVQSNNISDGHYQPWAEQAS
nr:unnamed protein product [Callosobruchus analis]